MLTQLLNILFIETMKKIIFMALLATTIFACSNEDNEVTQETTNLKSLDFSFDVASPKTRMSDDKVTEAITAVRNNIQSITIEYFNASSASLGTYDFTPEQVAMAKGDDQDAAAAGRSAVRISSIPSATTKVNVYMNVDKSAADINDLQIGYTKMEYCGTPEDITLKTAGGERTDGSTNDLYSVEVSVAPVLSRFEFHGKASDIKVNSSASGTLPSGVENGTKDQAKDHVSDATITAAEKAAQEAWRKANPGSPDPTWSFTYTVTYEYDAAYTITGIDGYYMNNIPLTKGGNLVINANNGTGDWNDAAKDKYKIDGDMEKMFDTTVEADKVIAYNLFPQTATNGTGASTTDVKTSMPHFVLKLATSASGTASPRWLTIRALKAADALVTSFDAGKVYVLNAADININQYSAKLKVTANGTVGPEIPEPVDPTDPNPEPVGKDLDVLVKITKWTIVNVKPEW